MTLFVGSACPIALVTGLPCPACGLTRACMAAVTLHFAEAFTYHPLFLAVPVVFAVGVWGLIRPEILDKKWLTIGAFTLVAAFIVTYIVRMALYFPYIEPMTYRADSLLGLLLKHWKVI